jgi:hypothetical protein
MATINKNFEETLTLKSEANSILISVKTGDGQGGSYLIYNGNKRIGVNKTAKIEKGSNCSENISIVVIIKDKLPDTNWTSATIIIKEENQPTITYGPYQQEVLNDFDTIIYGIDIKVEK